MSETGEPRNHLNRKRGKKKKDIRTEREEKIKDNSRCQLKPFKMHTKSSEKSSHQHICVQGRYFSHQ